MGTFSTLGFLFLNALLYSTYGQHFDGSVEDKTYLDNVHLQVGRALQLATSNLVAESTALRQITEDFLLAKMKENLFKALRPFAEKELGLSSDRNGRQNLGEEEEEEDEEDEGADSTTKRPSANIIPHVANLIKAIFGGNRINITSYAQQATKFLPPAFGNQVLGVVKLLVHSPPKPTTTTAAPVLVTQPTTPSALIVRLNLTSTSSSPVGKLNSTNTDPTTPATPKIIAILTPKESIKSGTLSTTPNPKIVTTTTRKTRTTTEEEDEDEDEDFFRQLRIPGLDAINNAIGGGINSLLGGSAPRRPNVNATTESESGFEPETTQRTGFDLGSVASGIRLGLGDLIKVVPDLFKGAREAVGLLSGIQSLLGSFTG